MMMAILIKKSEIIYFNMNKKIKINDSILCSKTKKEDDDDEMIVTLYYRNESIRKLHHQNL